MVIHLGMWAPKVVEVDFAWDIPSQATSTFLKICSPVLSIASIYGANFMFLGYCGNYFCSTLPFFWRAKELFQIACLLSISSHKTLLVCLY